LFSEGERIMTFLAFLLFLLVSPTEGLQGAVVDPTGAAVANARVEISRGDFLRATTTDETGSFSIEEAPAGTYALRVTANGFTVHVSSIDIPSVALKLALKVAPHSEDVIVTTTRVETPLNMLGVSATVIDSSEIARQQSSPIYELLR